MVLRLILMRHAKSGWDDPLLADHDRPLTPRGVDAADRIGRWLADRGHEPQEAMVSSALRTRQTWDGVCAALPPCELHVVPALYLAGPDTMLNVLKGASARVVLMLGHNPGIAEFARLLLRTLPAHPRFSDYPTAATLVAEFDIPKWDDARFATARPIDFVVPRDLTAD